MRSHWAGQTCQLLVLVLCLSTAEGFHWTTNDHGSFYYGTFPKGRPSLHEHLQIGPRVNFKSKIKSFMF